MYKSKIEKAAHRIRAIREILEELSDDERIDLLDLIMEGYCKYCGTKTDRCYCQNDD